MPTPVELAFLHTDLRPDELAHLQRLLGSWSVLADLSFSDLLLVVPVSRSHPDLAGDEPQMVVLGQIRPSNRPTLVDQDLVGQTVRESAWQLCATALHTGEVVRGAVHHPGIGDSVPVENVPVGFGGRVIGVLLRVSGLPPRGPSSTYEKSYLEVFERLAQMVAESAFPFPDEDVGTEEAPRVGDGFVVVDAEGRVEFASPNAVNAFHRMGVYSPPEGARFTELGVEESAVEWALATGRPVVEEVERRPDVIVLAHCIPLLSHGSVTGAVILLRDVTDVRRLDRLLLSKDAAIREVHHRVKNNLQTISSLLSLQARRVAPGSGREALREAERRVRSIALVHEILSRDPGDQVPFDDIVASLVQMAKDSVVSPDRIEITVAGRSGRGHGGRGHAARRHPGRGPAERRGARLRPRPVRRRGGRGLRRRRRGRRPAGAGPRDGQPPGPGQRGLRSGSGTTAAASPRGSTSSAPPAWACRSCGIWWSTRWGGPSPWSGCRTVPAAGPGC